MPAGQPSRRWFPIRSLWDAASASLRPDRRIQYARWDICCALEMARNLGTRLERWPLELFAGTTQVLASSASGAALHWKHGPFAVSWPSSLRVEPIPDRRHERVVP